MRKETYVWVCKSVNNIDGVNLIELRKNARTYQGFIINI